MSSNIEILVKALLNGETVNLVPQSRVEKYLVNCLNGSGTEGLPVPQSRLDILLWQLAEKGVGGSDEFIIDDFSYFCAEGNRLDMITTLDTSNGTDFSKMFYQSRALTTIPQIDTSSGTNFEYMFGFCSALTTIPQLDTSSGTDFSDMFSNCTSLTTIPQLDTSSSTSFGSMFYNCTSLTTIPQLDTGTCTYFSSMFTGCKSLTVVPQLNLNGIVGATSGVDYGYMFQGCVSLTTVDLLNFGNCNKAMNMFHNCYALTNCRITNIRGSLQVASGTTYGHLLTVDSLIGLIYELCNTGWSTTLTIGSANLDKLANVYVKTIEITDEMRAEDDLIDEKLPFVVCESTDEGAMLIEDYVTSKNWVLK